MAKATGLKPIWMKREGNSLVPVDEEATERVRAIKRDQLVMVGMRQPRNPHQHRMAWGLARIVYDNTERFDNAEHAMENIKILAGYCDRKKFLIATGDGDKSIEIEQVCGRSIAFESMDQIEFEEFLQAMIRVIATTLMPGVDPVALLKEVR